MDLIVTPLLGLLVPHLPALLMKAAEDVVGEGAKKAVYEAVPGGVKAIWAKLKPKVEASPIVQSAVEKVAIEPANPKRVTALEVAIEDLLGELAKTEPTLIGELQELLKTAQTEAGGGKNAGTINAQNVYGLIQGDNAKLTQNFGTSPTDS
jgi:hypothetical protein